ncbi:MAG: O-antigen ligase family protein [bacterium]|nr:O-antigen ligase family protein [bacterium]
MNKIIKQNLNKYLGIFILLQPIIDLITGICLNVFNLNLTIGIIIRMLFLMFIMYTTVFIYKKKKSSIYYLVFIIYTILYLLANIIFKDSSIFSELQGLLRVFYFPLLLISLYDLKDEIKISKMTLVITLFIYIIAIFIPILLNVGFKTYQITKTGTLGFYNSANEISGIISIITPLIFIIFKETKGIIIKVLLTLLYLFVILTIGTKTPLLALLITIGMTYIWLIIHYLKNKKYKPLLISFSLIVVGLASLIIIIPKTNFYKNIIVHLDYLQVDNITDIFQDEKLIDHFIFSERITFYGSKKSIYQNSNIYQKLFGIGYINDNKLTKLIEMDYYDIYYSHGLLGFLLFMSIPLYILFKFSFQKRTYNFNMYMINTSLLLIIILSLMTGHIITAPAVSIIVVIIILYLDCEKKKGLLFTAYNLDLGGIETALINLLNNINYDKYNVTLILEQKQGMFLSEINKNVRVEEIKVSNHPNKLIRKFVNLTRQLFFVTLNYHNYDFSCCYATYSLSGNKLTRIASHNTALYIHSNYKYVYKTEKEVKEFFDNRHIGSFKHLIFVSNEAKNDFLELYPNLNKKCLVFNNFIDIDKVECLAQEKIPTKKPKDKTLFVFVGRLDDDSKKVSRAISLIRNLKDCELWIIGDGKDRQMYEKEVKKQKLQDRVIFHGKKSNPYPYIKASDYIILTSDYEGFPVIYLEALVLKKPIITTIATSDDKINISDGLATIVPKDVNKMLPKVKKLLEKSPKAKEIDLNKIQKERMKNLEKIFDEVK